ncbi:hypothetical protein [Rathayibacter rathayi]|uniref:hypothetical protein n=1 Tax=Rathayibacter rathayi TaxID=33887 RepID=UPI000BC6139C|nr:hypothetical protein [Rathayibacter rathayi]AZZ50080.1 hypothetical protein C1O28_13510 [Rathayibacter rathayi]MWV74644.1 hypothetical protein [Rathayibacter rathayi NCPPB 2980 = VKM Ac-1601]PPF23265.1 hypothetical protein C5C34_09485 [Rathayibacter rathayi]PPF42004.1 hypothetical protein C5C08_15490 [Rathayibacter rathayi]PPF74059.1 hypothetical protein C5C14_15675 [Rathayibacter rathayi]
MHRRAAIADPIGFLSALSLSGCSVDEPETTTATVGRGGERAEVLGGVVVCSGSVDGLDLAASDSAPLTIGDGLRRVTRWVSPSPVTQLGATDLSGVTVWPADTEIERFPLGVDLALKAYATGRSVLSRPVVLTAEQFDTLSVGEIVVGDVRDGISETLSAQEFLGLACTPR